MKKRILIGGSIFFVITLLSFMADFSITKDNDFSTLLANVEAIASSSEGGSGARRVRHDTHGGKEYTKLGGYVTYERLYVGDICLKWEHYKPSGSPNGYCFTYE